AAAHGEQETAAGKLIEARYGLGRDDRIALGKERNAGAELEGTRCCGRERQRDERIVRVGVALGELAAGRKGRAVADRDMGVLAREQRRDAARLERARKLSDLDAVIGREMECADEHGLP